MSRSKAWGALVVWSLIPAASAFAQQPLRDLALVPLGPELADNAETKYRKKWAVIVGVDYRANDRPQDLGEIPALAHAEQDACDVHDLLTSKFGFVPGDASLFLGPSATKGKVLGKIGEIAADAEVTAEDCVIVYFAGHGVVQRSPVDNSPLGYLIPIDVEWMKNNQPNPGTAIDMEEVVEYLNRCPARHKLLILDCCHSGLVFRLYTGRPGDPSDYQLMGKDVFASPAFQAISASRDNQKASDGLNGHSPFTNALLESLKTLPLQHEQTRGHRNFTASQLFEKMKPYLSGEDQTGQCQRISNDSGEFHFLPDGKADFSEGITDETARAELLAMAPTTFGNWWAYEVPWFMPGLRLAILQSQVPNRSGLYELDRASLEAAARRAIEKSNTSDSPMDPVFKLRYGHLNKLLEAPTGDRRIETMREIVRDLEAQRETNALHPEDVHYLAVIYQLLGNQSKADENYKKALKDYRDDAQGSRAKLRALCLLDAMVLAMSQNQWPLAKTRLFRAREQFKGQEPAPFQIYALCREADLYRREGKFGMSWSRMEQAVDLCTRWDPEETMLLSANTRKTRAWAHMESWNFKKANEDFNATKRMLEKQAIRSQFEAQIDRLHVRHGLAMIERYQGRTADALAAYRRLTPDIAAQLRELENRRDVDLPNYAEIRNLLVDRAVNTLERQADCDLFGEPPDYAEAADDYRRALSECQNLAKRDRDVRRIDLLYRRAIALCLHVTNQGPESPNVAQLRDLAKDVCKEADKLCDSLRADETLRALPRRTQLVQLLAGSCLKLCNGSEESTTTAPWEMLDELAANPNDYDRDELERLMFFYRTLLVHRDLFDIPAYVSQSHIAKLLSLCRSACRFGAADAELLAYLRPYYDTAFIAQCELLPGDTKSLIEIASEATRGEPYMKPAAAQPRAVLYVAGGKCHLLLDAPGGHTKRFALDDVTGAQDLVSASRTGDLFALPDQIRLALREVRRKFPSEKITLCWNDPVLKLGHHVGRPVAPPDGSDAFAGSSPTLVFPFVMQGTLKPNEYIEDANPQSPPTPQPQLSSDEPTEPVSHTTVN